MAKSTPPPPPPNPNYESVGAALEAFIERNNATNQEQTKLTQLGLDNKLDKEPSASKSGSKKSHDRQGEKIRGRSKPLGIDFYKRDKGKNVSYERN